jgi:general secretion pathway protein G
MNDRLSSRCARRAFTLVELLVVVAIVALLIGILMPALSKSRRQANAIACAANLRQWAVAARMYADANHDYLPRRGYGQNPAPNPIDVQNPYDWFNALPPMLRMTNYGELANAARVPRPGQQSVWLCPEALDPNPSKNLFTYGMNMGLSVWSATLPDKITRVGQPATMIFMLDARGANCSVWPSADAKKTYNPDARHGNRANVAFLDGHVASYTGAELGVGSGVPINPEFRWWTPKNTWPGPP